MRTVRKNGSELVDVYSGIVQHECGRAWWINWQKGGRLPRRWWWCLDGCHDVIQLDE